MTMKVHCLMFPLLSLGILPLYTTMTRCSALRLSVSHSPARVMSAGPALLVSEGEWKSNTGFFLSLSPEGRHCAVSSLLQAISPEDKYNGDRAGRPPGLGTTYRVVTRRQSAASLLRPLRLFTAARPPEETRSHPRRLGDGGKGMAALRLGHDSIAPRMWKRRW